MNQYRSVDEAGALKMPNRGYLLCCIERTGSNLLAGALSQKGAAGRPVEYFNPVEQGRPWMREILGESALADGLPKVLIAGSTPNGVFGAKVHWSHFRFLGMSIKREWNESQRIAMYQLLRSRLPTLLPEAAASELLRAHFSDLSACGAAYGLIRSQLPDLRMIWLRRKNMVARAISHFRARQTGIWYRDAATSGIAPDEKNHDFDLAEIHTLNCLGAFHEESWQRFFQEYEISPHCVIYEELVADYAPTVRRVLKFLGMESREVIIPQTVSLKQSDALSEEWEERYRMSIKEAGI